MGFGLDTIAGYSSHVNAAKLIQWNDSSKEASAQDEIKVYHGDLAYGSDLMAARGTPKHAFEHHFNKEYKRLITV